MKQREWMGYAAAVLAAGAFLAGCGNIRKLVKSDPEVGVHLPARSAQNPVAQAADTARSFSLRPWTSIRCRARR